MKSLQRLLLTEWSRYRGEQRWASSRSVAMSKKKIKSAKDAGKSMESSLEEKSEIRSQAVELRKDGSFALTIQAKPGARQNAVTEVLPEVIGVQIAAPAMEGEANAALTKYLASVIGIRKSDVSLIKGMKSRTKVVTVTASGWSAEELLDRFKKEAKPT